MTATHEPEVRAAVTTQVVTGGQVGPVPADVLARYFDHMRAKGYQPGTIDQKRHVLRRLSVHLDGVELVDARADQIVGFLDRVDVADSERASEKSHVRSFYRWAASAGVIDGDPTACLRVKRAALSNRTLGLMTANYVQERVDKGELAARSAEGLRSKLWDFAASTDAKPENITRATVERWMARPGLSASYRRTRLSAVRGFCEWMLVNGHIRRDPTLGLRAPKIPPLLPRALTADQADAVMDTAGADPRTKLMVSLMLQEALRRKEVAELQVGDVDLRKRTVMVRGKGGHGQVTDTLPLTDQTMVALRSYLAAEGLGGSGPLIRSRVHPDRGLSPATVGQLVKDAMVAAGVKERARDGKSAHALRHTAAQDLVDSGADIRKVQRVLRHASIRNTEVYLRGEVRGIRDVMAGRTYGGA